MPHRSTQYAEAHEWAHVTQHARLTPPWRIFMATHRVPVIGRLAKLAVEVEAARIALRELKLCQLHTGKDTVEAAVNLLTYVGAIFGVDEF